MTKPTKNIVTDEKGQLLSDPSNIDPSISTNVIISLDEYNRLKAYENETFYRLTRQDLIDVLDTYDISLTDSEIDDCFDHLYNNFYLLDWMVNLKGWINGWLDGRDYDNE